MKPGAQHRITYDYRDHEGSWERVAVATLSVPEVFDMLLWLGAIDPAARAALSQMEQEAALQGMVDPDSGLSIPTAVPN